MQAKPSQKPHGHFLQFPSRQNNVGRSWQGALREIWSCLCADPKEGTTWPQPSGCARAGQEWWSCCSGRAWCLLPSSAGECLPPALVLWCFGSHAEQVAGNAVSISRSPGPRSLQTNAGTVSGPHPSSRSTCRGQGSGAKQGPWRAQGLMFPGGQPHAYKSTAGMMLAGDSAVGGSWSFGD